VFPPETNPNWFELIFSDFKSVLVCFVFQTKKPPKKTTLTQHTPGEDKETWNANFFCSFKLLGLWL